MADLTVCGYYKPASGRCESSNGLMTYSIRCISTYNGALFLSTLSPVFFLISGIECSLEAWRVFGSDCEEIISQRVRLPAVDAVLQLSRRWSVWI